MNSPSGARRDLIRVLVADSGTGIPKELLSSIFEPFVTTKGEKGTGLGLWIVRGIIGNHGGKISVRSKVGKGTTISVRLPMFYPETKRTEVGGQDPEFRR